MSQHTVATLFVFIENRLIDYGLSPQYAGFHYLAHAIHLTILDKQASIHLKTHLYQPIAEQFGISASAVEHGIRNLLSCAWKRHETPALHNLFAVISSPPTNARCIALLARVIRTQYFLARQQSAHLWRQPPTGT